MAKLQIGNRTTAPPIGLTIVALGANAAPRRSANRRRVLAGLAALRRVLGRGVVASPLWASPAWPPGSGPDFVNAVCVLPCRMAPAAVLARLHRIEAAAGRIRGARWSARSLDLDLIAAGGAVRPDRATLRRWIALDPAAQRRSTPDGLVLPHPRMQDRAFVLLPLLALAPGWRHPTLGRDVAGMAAALPRRARAGLRPLAARDGPARRVARDALANRARRS